MQKYKTAVKMRLNDIIIAILHVKNFRNPQYSFCHIKECEYVCA